MKPSPCAIFVPRVLLFTIIAPIGLAPAQLMPINSALGAPQLTLTVSAPAYVPPDSSVTIEISRTNTEQGLGGLAYNVNLSQTLLLTDREYGIFGWIANDGLFDNSVPLDDGAVSSSVQTFRFDTVVAGAAGAEFPPNTGGIVERFTIRTPPLGVIPPQGLTITVDLTAVSASDGDGLDWMTSLGGAITVSTDANGHAATFVVTDNADCNVNGVIDDSDIAFGTSIDCNGDGIPDECQHDYDGDNIIDDCDNDIDNDGVLNASDACLSQPGAIVNGSGGPAGDFDNDCGVTLADYDSFSQCLAAGGPMANPGAGCLDTADFDLDGDVDIIDVSWLQAAIAEDCFDDCAPDDCHLDFDGDGVTDDCDNDIDNDNVVNASDTCVSAAGSVVSALGGPIGDFNGDCVLTLADYPQFAACLDASGPAGSPGLNCLSTADADRDNDVDLADVAALQTAMANQP